MLIGWKAVEAKEGKDCYAQCRGVLNWILGEDSSFPVLLAQTRAYIKAAREDKSPAIENLKKFVDPEPTKVFKVPPEVAK